MSLIAANGQDAIETRLVMPRTGAWHCDLIVDDPAGLAGRVTIVIDTNDGAPVAMVGTAVRSGVFVDTAHIRVVAGAGGLGTSATPRHYVGVSVGVVLGDLLAGAGERLSGTADRNVLSAPLDAWTTTAAPIGTLITLLLAAAAPGATWRLLADGTVWVGTDTFPDAGVDESLYQIREDAAEQNAMRILVDGPLVLVGTTFEGRRVSATEAHVGQEGQGIEQWVWFEDAGPAPTVDQLRAALTSLAQKAVARTDRIDYSRRYPAFVIGQAPTDPPGVLDVEPLPVDGQPRLADMGRAPLFLGLPGTTVTGLGGGGRVLVGWLGGNPSQPYVAGFDADTTLDGAQLSIAGGTQGAARVGDPVKLILSPADIAAIAAALIAGGLVMPGSGGSAPPPVPITGENVIAGGSAIVKVG